MPRPSAIAVAFLSFVVLAGCSGDPPSTTLPPTEQTGLTSDEVRDVMAYCTDEDSPIGCSNILTAIEENSCSLRGAYQAIDWIFGKGPKPDCMPQDWWE